MADERLRVIVEFVGKDAEKKAKALGKALAGAGKDAKKAEDMFVLLGKKILALGVVMKAARFVKSSTLLAARVETLAVVTETLGRNVGLTEQEVRSLERAIVDQGITLQASRQSIAMMIQGNIDLANATDLARLAQDTAVIANVNSSEAFQRLVYVLQTGNVRMARTLGLNVQFGVSYKRLAKELGKTTEELTEQEQMLARTGEVMKAGSRIAGTYEAAMETTGKKMLSMDRQIEELSRGFGEIFLPVLGDVVDMLYTAAKAILDAREAAKDHEESVDDLTDSYIKGTLTEQDFIAGLQDEQRALQDAKEGAGFLEGALLTLQQARITGMLIYKEEALVGADSIDARREAARWTNVWTEAQYAAYHGISLLTDAEEEALTTTQRLQQQFEDARGAIEGTTDTTKELTEAQYYEMAAEALLAGNTRLAQHYVDMATQTAEAKRETLELIAALEALDGKKVSYDIVGFHRGMGGPSFLDQGLPGPSLSPGWAGVPEGGFATYAEGVAAGGQFVGGQWVKKQHGGPLGRGWTLVGDPSPQQELISPWGWVFDAKTTKKLMESGLVPGTKRAVAGPIDGGTGPGGTVITDPVWAWGPTLGTTWEEAATSGSSASLAAATVAGITGGASAAPQVVEAAVIASVSAAANVAGTQAKAMKDTVVAQRMDARRSDALLVRIADGIDQLLTVDDARDIAEETGSTSGF